MWHRCLAGLKSHHQCDLEQNLDKEFGRRILYNHFAIDITLYLNLTSYSTYPVAFSWSIPVAAVRLCERYCILNIILYIYRYTALYILPIRRDMNLEDRPDENGV